MTLGNDIESAPTRRSVRGTRDLTPALRTGSSVAPATAKPRFSRRRGVKGVFAATAVIGFAGVYVVPATIALADSETAVPQTAAVTTSFALAEEGAQSIRVHEDAPVIEFTRDTYEVYVKPKPKPTQAPQAASGGGGGSVHYSGGGSKDSWLAASGIAQSDWGYVDFIVSRESGWNPNATNRSSGACGLVQALPCSKVPGNGYNPVDNLRWANGYAIGRYGSWANAYAFWTSRHWW